MKMHEKIKNSDLPECHKIKLQCILNPDQIISMSGREFIKNLCELEESAMKYASKRLKAENAKLREALQSIESYSAWNDHVWRIAYEALKDGE